MITANGKVVQYGKESVYGELVVPTARAIISKADFSVDPTKADEGLITGGIAASPVETYGIKVNGDVSMPARPNNVGDMLFAALGAQAAPVLHASSTAAYDHVITPVGNKEADLLPSLSFILDKIVGVFGYFGCVIDSLTLTAGAGASATMDLTIVGRDEKVSASLVSGLTTAARKSFKLSGGVIKFAGTELAKLVSFTLSWANGCDTDSQYSDTGLHYARPEQGQRSCSTDIEVVYSSAVEAIRRNYWLSDSQFSLEFTLESEEMIEAKIPYAVKFSIPAAQIGSYSESWAIGDKTSCSLSLNAVEDGINPLITVTVTDDRETAYLA